MSTEIKFYSANDHYGDCRILPYILIKLEVRSTKSIMKQCLLLFVLFFVFCFSGNAQEKGALIYKEGNKEVRFEFENRLSYLEIDKTVRMKMYVEDIDLKKSSLVGRGIKNTGIGCGDNCVVWNITVSKESVIDGYFKMIFMYRIKDDDELIKYKFLIPVK